MIKIEERNEERTLNEMAAAGRKYKSAEEALSGAQRAARTDHRRSAPAMDWLLAEIAHTRALHEVRTAENEMKTAAEAAGLTRARYSQAHSKAEALRRVAQARADEILAARRKTESRELDDIGLLPFTRGQHAN